MPSPRIASIEWGRITLDDGSTFKDARLFPGGSREWDWNETGTHHEPGIQPADVAELLEHGATTIVLSRGFHERLSVCSETIELLQRRGIQRCDIHIAETGKAARLYNMLAADHAIAGLFHSTC